METCKDILDLLSEYMEGDLSPERSRAFENHMKRCHPCLDYLDSIRDTSSLAESLRCDEIPDAVKRSLRDFLDRELKDRRR